MNHAPNVSYLIRRENCYLNFVIVAQLAMVRNMHLSSNFNLTLYYLWSSLGSTNPEGRIDKFLYYRVKLGRTTSCSFLTLDPQRRDLYQFYLSFIINVYNFLLLLKLLLVYNIFQFKSLWCFNDDSLIFVYF